MYSLPRHGMYKIFRCLLLTQISEFEHYQLINIIQFMMQSKLELKNVVHKLFGSGLKEVTTPASYWQMFKTYTTCTGHNDTTVLLKLIEIPANYRTSQEIIEKMKQQYKDILHHVDFILVSRNFDHDLYLLKATQNMISVESLIQIRRQAGQKVDEQIIQDFLEFAATLENHPFGERISFKLDQIGVTQSGKFLLANYAMYFACNENKKERSLNQDIKNAVLRLLMPDSNNFDLSEMYSHVEENYKPSIQTMVQKCMADSEFRASEVVTTAFSQGQNNVMQTTITDSFHSDPMLGEQIANMTSLTGDLSENLLNTSCKQKTKKNRFRAPIFAMIFIIILIAIGAVTFAYLKPRPLDCQASQFLDQDSNKCLSCDPSCNTCMDQSKEMCLSCKDSMYLVKRDRSVRVGKCSASCVGTPFKNNVCIINV